MRLGVAMAKPDVDDKDDLDDEDPQQSEARLKNVYVSLIFPDLEKILDDLERASPWVY